MPSSGLCHFFVTLFVPRPFIPLATPFPFPPRRCFINENEEAFYIFLDPSIHHSCHCSLWFLFIFVPLSSRPRSYTSSTTLSSFLSLQPVFTIFQDILADQVFRSKRFQCSRSLFLRFVHFSLFHSSSHTGKWYYLPAVQPLGNATTSYARN